MPASSRSLSSLLIFRLLSVSTLLVGGITWLAYQDVRYEARELFDAQLAQSAREILSLVQADHDARALTGVQNYMDENKPDVLFPGSAEEDGSTAQVEDGHVYETKLGFQVWDAHGNLIIRSPNVPITPITTDSGGYGQVDISGAQWRVFSLTSHDRRYRCITAERLDVRADLIGKISHDLLLLSISLLIVLAITIWLTTRRGLDSLDRLARAISQRDPERLDPLAEHDDPREIDTITREINGLLGRLSDALERERLITNDAAHELRTPLAAVRVHAELASSATTAGQRSEAIGKVLKGIDRTSRMIEQLLSLARLEPEVMQQRFGDCELAMICTEEAAALAPLALDKDIELSIEQGDDNAVVRGEASSLRLLVKNLIDNAINYTPRGGVVSLRLFRNGDSSCLELADNGPGIPSHERELVLQRFHRSKHHEQSGCGIGLSIVARVCELHHASLQLDDSTSDGGLTVTVCFPPRG